MPPASLFPRKLPRQDRSAATVAAIIEAAAQILDGDGLEAFNTNAVARRAGVSIGSVYQYFPGKDALTARLIRQDHEALLAALDAAIEAARGASLDEAMLALAKVAVDHQFDRPRLARILDIEEERLTISRESEATLVAIAGRVAAVLAGHFPGIAARTLDVAAGDLLAMAKGIVDFAAQGTAPERDDVIRRVAWALLGYLSHMKTSAPDRPLAARGAAGMGDRAESVHSAGAEAR